MALRKPKKIVQSAWHPNFRNVETLPDIKAIRTDFIINWGIVLVAAVLLMFFLKNEIAALSVGRSIKEFETKISENTGKNNNNLRLSGEFGTLSKKISELTDFVKAPVTPSIFLLTFAQVKPEEMLMQSISYDSQTIDLGNRKTAPGKLVTLQSTVNGTPAAVTQLVTEYVETIKNLDIIKESVHKVELQSLERDENLGLFNCSIRVELIPPINK